MTATVGKSGTTIVARDIMTSDPICVAPSETLRELARIFDDNDISGVPVVDIQNRLIGVVSTTDLIHRVAIGPDRAGPSTLVETLAQGFGEDDVDDVVVEDLMSGEPIFASPEEPVGRLARRMAEERVHRVVIVDDDREPVGIVSSFDVLKVYPV